MEIDLNDPSEFTLENVRRLIASKDDSKHRQLRITKKGKAFISDDVGCDNLEELAFRFETMDAGNGYVGIEASKDSEYVNRIYKALKKNWPNPEDEYIDFF